MKLIAKLFGLAALATVSLGCPAGDEPTEDLSDRYGVESTTFTEEPVAFTSTPYDFEGPDTIEQLLDTIGSGNTWYGVSSESDYPVDGPCDPFGAEVEEVPEYPMQIEGIVTLHPRYFFKPAHCASDERYYGSYFVQDSTGGVMVLRDSRIAPFTFGDRIRMTVHGATKFFDTRAVNIATDVEVLSSGNEIYYEEPDDSGLLGLNDIGKVMRIRGEVVVPPTNFNFNQMCLIPEGGDPEKCDPRCVGEPQCRGKILVSVDREIGQRNPAPIEKGDVLEVTGPVINSFGLQVLVMRIGQITFVE